LSVKRKSKSQPARKAAAKPAAKRKSTPPKVSRAKTTAKKAAAGKSVARKGASVRAGQNGPAAKRAKPKNIFAKTKKTAKSKAKRKPAATKSDRNSIVQNVPLIEALDQALSGHPTPVAMPGERHANGAPDLSGNADGDQGRPPPWRPSLGESGSESADMPARANKLVPTNAVHTTKRRMKRNTWQSPVLGLGAVAAVVAVLVFGNDNEPPDVSPLERRVEAQPSAPVQQTAKTASTQKPVSLAQPAMPESRGKGAAQRPDSPRGLRVLELVEMERMLARLEMGPSQPDGVVDLQTKTAIRTYQQIAGLPVDGEATPELLDDMREVVKMMDGAN
jgi:peptidoglycan hydrolase-like protein with peptidoglycan-binding domain